MIKIRLCHGCARSPLTHPDDLERWLRSRDYSTREACDRCERVEFTCVFRPKTSHVLTNLA